METKLYGRNWCVANLILRDLIWSILSSRMEFYTCTDHSIRFSPSSGSIDIHMLGAYQLSSYSNRSITIRILNQTMYKNRVTGSRWQYIHIIAAPFLSPVAPIPSQHVPQGIGWWIGVTGFVNAHTSTIRSQHQRRILNLRYGYTAMTQAVWPFSSPPQHRNLL